MSRTLRIAAAQYPLTPIASLAEYQAKVSRWVGEAAAEGAELLVFPEYGAMELASIGGRGSDIEGAMDAVSALVPELSRIHRALAIAHGVTIVAGSAPERRSNGTYNVARIFGPKGAEGSHDKIMPTPGERQSMNIKGGRTLSIFDIGKAKVGLVICYDIEFPLIARSLAEAGAEVILAPSDTETEWGYWRVRTGAMARALENQVLTVHAPLVGQAPFCAGFENAAGAAGIYAPSDMGFPPGGIMALGEMNVSQWLYAEVDLELLAEVREAGMVQTFRYWPEQPGAAVLPKAKTVNLTS